MCFSAELSFFNFGLLAGYASYLQMYSKEKDIWKIFIPLYYLSIIDFIQGFQYIFNNNQWYKYIFSVLTYINICFQPVFVNLFFSFFSASFIICNTITYWNFVFIITFLFGLYELTNLDVFDIFKEAPYCKDKSSDYCSDKNGSYIGKYHVAYKFKTKYDYSLFFYFFMIVPSLLTNSFILSVIWFIFMHLLKLIFYNVRNGEKGAIWCLLSIVPTLPVVYYRKEVLEFIETIKIY